MKFAPMQRSESPIRKQKTDLSAPLFDWHDQEQGVKVPGSRALGSAAYGYRRLIGIRLRSEAVFYERHYNSGRIPRLVFQPHSFASGSVTATQQVKCLHGHHYLASLIADLNVRPDYPSVRL